MTRYSIIYATVFRLTDNPTLRAFFIIYLLAENEVERDALNTRFWRDLEGLDENSHKEMREAMQRSFLQLLPVTDDLLGRVREAKTERSALAA